MGQLYRCIAKPHILFAHVCVCALVHKLCKVQVLLKVKERVYVYVYDMCMIHDTTVCRLMPD